MMLRTIEQAVSIKALEDELKEGLPKDFHDYLLKQVQNLAPSQFIV
jgi:hypothetical protein